MDKLEGFRSSIEDYFKKRTDVIEQVIKCEVENYGNNVKLVTKMKMKRGWIFFFLTKRKIIQTWKGSELSDIAAQTCLTMISLLGGIQTLKLFWSLFWQPYQDED